MRKFFCLLIVLTSAAVTMAQDAALTELANSAKQLRKATREVKEGVVAELSAEGRPKLTLMDDIRSSEGEYRGDDAKRFDMNKVVVKVHGSQKGDMAAKGEFFDSREKGFCYSAIEKCVVRGATVTYTLTGHEGEQEFMFVAFRPAAKFVATVNGQQATAVGDGVQHVNIGRVKPADVITLTIRLDRTNGAANESFVILNHNPQK